MKKLKLILSALAIVGIGALTNSVVANVFLPELTIPPTTDISVYVKEAAVPQPSMSWPSTNVELDFLSWPNPYLKLDAFNRSIAPKFYCGVVSMDRFARDALKNNKVGYRYLGKVTTYRLIEGSVNYNLVFQIVMNPFSY